MALEKKFLVNALPEELSEPVEIDQIYLDLQSSIIAKIIKLEFTGIDYDRLTQALIHVKSHKKGKKIWLKVRNNDHENSEDAVKAVRIDEERLSIIQRRPYLFTGNIEKSRYEIDLPGKKKLPVLIDAYRGRFKGLVLAVVQCSDQKFEEAKLAKKLQSVWEKFVDVSVEPIFRDENLAKISCFPKLKLQINTEQANLLPQNYV